MTRAIVAEAELICRFGSEEHLDTIWQVTWNHSGTMLASCSSDKTVRLWSSTRKDQQQQQQQLLNPIGTPLADQHTRSIRSLAFSPNPRTSYLATASFDATIGIWQNSPASGTFELSTCLEGHENEVKAVAWSSDGKLLATCGRDKTVWIWETSLESDEEDFQCLAVLQDHTQDVKCVQWHPNMELLVSAAYDNAIKLWAEDSMDDWACVQTLTGHKSTVWAVAFDGTGEYLVSVGDDRSLRLWKSVGGPGEAGNANYVQVAVVEELHQRPIYSVSWSPDNQIIATGGGDNQICLLKLVDGDRLEKVGGIEQAHVTDVNCVSWRPQSDNDDDNCSGDGSVVLASCSDDDIALWRVHIK